MVDLNKTLGLGMQEEEGGVLVGPCLYELLWSTPQARKLLEEALVAWEPVGATNPSVLLELYTCSRARLRYSRLRPS